MFTLLRCENREFGNFLYKYDMIDVTEYEDFARKKIN